MAVRTVNDMGLGEQVVPDKGGRKTQVGLNAPGWAADHENVLRLRAGKESVDSRPVSQVRLAICHADEVSVSIPS